MDRKSNQKSSRARRGARKQDLTAEVLTKVSRTLGNLNAGATIMVRRLTTSGTIATNGAGAVALGTLCSSSAVNAATDFASVSNLYVGYRVKAMRVHLFPIYVANVAGVAPPPSTVAVGMFSSGLSVTTYANILDSAQCQFFSGYRRFTTAVNWDNIPDAKLWTPNNAAISSTEVYGLVFMGATGNPAAQVTTAYWNYVVEYETEFITAA